MAIIITDLFNFVTSATRPEPRVQTPRCGVQTWCRLLYRRIRENGVTPRSCPPPPYPPPTLCRNRRLNKHAPGMTKKANRGTEGEDGIRADVHRRTQGEHKGG